jgi:hypothetical protein
MTEQAPALTRHDLEARVVKHSWEDEKFRKEFLADPAATFVKYLKVPKESLPKIVVHEETPGSWHIVLPPKPADANELSEEDLEKVAGGTTPIVSTVVTIISASVAGSAGVTLVSAIVSGEVGGW